MSEDNTKMTEVRTEKAVFFDKFQTIQRDISSILQNLTVYPPEFHKLCDYVEYLLDQLRTIQSDFDSMNKQLSEEIKNQTRKKQELMRQCGLSNYEITNAKFKELIAGFTITAHKEAAGKIGGFDVESGFSSGDITFF